MEVYIQNMLGDENNPYYFEKELDSFKVWYFKLIPIKFQRNNDLYTLSQIVYILYPIKIRWGLPFCVW